VDTERVQRWGHGRLSTFGIGTDLSRIEWAAIARELARIGLIEQSTDQFSTVDVTANGLDALRNRTPITLARPIAGGDAPRSSRKRSRSFTSTSPSGDLAPDEALFERLRQLRRELADQRNVPAYIILSDAALKQMAARKPQTEFELLDISGVGEKKLADFGAAFLAVIREHR
jgi:ATP-dependent DNA helicase RecQ